MSQMANFTVYDGSATPVAHVMVGISIQREGDTIVANYRENLASLPVEAQVNCIVTAQKLKSGVIRSSVRFNVPVMEAVNGQNSAGYTAAPKVAYVNTTELVSYAHPRSTTESRRLCRMLAINAGNGVATSVAAATSGMVSELIDSLITPT